LEDEFLTVLDECLEQVDRMKLVSVLDLSDHVSELKYAVGRVRNTIRKGVIPIDSEPAVRSAPFYRIAWEFETGGQVAGWWKDGPHDTGELTWFFHRVREDVVIWIYNEPNSTGWSWQVDFEEQMEVKKSASGESEHGFQAAIDALEKYISMREEKDPDDALGPDSMLKIYHTIIKRLDKEHRQQ
jgi:hypothetical protein